MCEDESKRSLRYKKETKKLNNMVCPINVFEAIITTPYLDNQATNAELYKKINKYNLDVI